MRTMKLTLAGCPIFLRSPQRGNSFIYHSALRIVVPDPLLPARLAVLRSDSQPHSPPACSAASVANRIPERVACSLPAAAFRRPRINATKPACAYYLFGADISQRPFARSQRLSVHRTTIPRSTFPACSFDALLSLRPARATFRSTVSLRFRIAAGGFIA
jgi:hypothetical protein